MAEPRAGQLDVCIVSWRTRDLLRACLGSVVGQAEVARIIVVDNASGDGTAEMVSGEFPDVELIANSENVGFSAGNNQAIRAGQAPFVLLLNADTEVKDGASAALLDVFQEHDRVGAVAAQLILPDGSVQRSCRSFPEPSAVLFDAFGLSRLFPRSERFGRYRMTYWDHDSRRDVDQPMASALAVRRAAFDEVGLFDESFPLYFNDVDLCYRLRQAAWRIVFEPKAKVLHHHGQSTWQVRPRAVLESHRSLIRFYRKHYRGRVGWLGYWAAIALAGLTMYPRAAGAWLLRGGR
ncbi:MAG TPA: glycosyltransferase family 2 protein [Armatimonadota bacterium]|nr:glycosyltransferase family 2 protein [Armatimonadota bacterium]